MTKRIFKSISVVAVSIFVASIALFMGVLFEYFSSVQHNQLKMQTSLAAQGVIKNGIDYFDGLNVENYRITLIDTDGSVIYDSKSDSKEMENHLEREEVKAALKSGYGESSRYSSTLMERSLYSAQLLPDGTILRLSIAQSTILTLLLGMSQPICVIFIIAIVLSLVLASRLSKIIVKPLNELNLDDPLSNDDYDEISPLLRRIDSQQKQIKQQSSELIKKQSEFDTVTTGMKEGLVLLNGKGEILSINRAATMLFETNNKCIGQDILSINRSFELQDILRKAEKGEFAEQKIHIADSEYQLDANPVISENKVTGIVLLIFDITEKEKSEQMRREFTANVSHELKTPLHTISGCAELIKNDMVKSEDIHRFSEQIYNEAQRMISLVEDIIKLSHLDEGANDMKKESVDLYEIAKDTVRSLAEEAKLANVTVDITGSSAIISGVPQLIHGIIYNLCDNAIKYNQVGGSVSVDVQNEEKTVKLTVSDTGIGIPQEHQERIFERFYRVDKSHSKAVGGTGLGLSIVKHAAKLHNAQVELHSVVDGGTTITVRFFK
ncbi:MAG: ATP-binding protein [Acutalibacteraceae bacterium]